MRGVWATVSGFGFFAPGLAHRAVGNVDDRFGLRLGGLFRIGLVRVAGGRLGFCFGRFVCGTGILPVRQAGSLPDFAEDFFGGGRGHFARDGFRGSFRSVSGGRRHGFPGRLRQSCLANARTFGLRHTQIADGRFRHRLHIRAEAGAGDLLLQLLRLLFKFAGAAIQRRFFDWLEPVCGGLLLRKKSAEPFAEPEIREEEQTDQTQRRINDRRANRSEQGKTELDVVTRAADFAIGRPAEQAADTLRANGFANFPAQSAVVREVKQAGERNQQNRRPQHRPARAFAQIAGPVQQEGRAKQRQHQRQQIAGNAQQQK